LFFEDSPMRKKVRQSGVTINAVAGNHVVMLGLDIDGTLRRGLRGFAIRRTDHTEEETYWMRGAKTFASVEPTPAVGEQFSSREHPFQSFQWSDYSAKPDHEYTYDVIALYGKPGELEERNSATVTIRTEPIIGADHTIFFNRGSIATQEYARRFQNKMPSEVGQAAYDWLSRGLAEGIRDFVGRAKNKNWTLKGAFYEFQWPAVIDAFREAKQRKVTVSIVFDDIKNATGPRKKNEKAIAAERLKSVCIPRTNGTLMHNKFIVLIEGKKPRAVLFGSTNLTENGLYGHANCAHIVENEDIAAKYLAFYEKLTEDPETSTKVSDYKNWTIEQTPAPAKKFSNGMAAVFSPRADLDALNWYAELAGAAKAGLFMTFAFGMNEQFRNVYGTNDDVLRMGLMEKEWNGRNKDAQIAAIRKLQARPNVVIAIGNRIPLTNFDQWLGELDRATDHVNVHWIHTKFMLIDPLSSNPTVITGSANFSDASTRTNDENMVVIKKDTRVADIYLGEFMRLHSHYAFRQAVKIFLEQNPGASPEDFQQRFLIEEGDWTKSYFDPNDRQARQTRREYFSGKS
jgi:phosphatidylserine/phosphatidylglycerophosphate/cardiolipin synthase-like enzyme